jgi:hypothetical protein
LRNDTALQAQAPSRGAHGGPAAQDAQEVLNHLLSECSPAMQDAQEFLNYLLNECSDLLEKEARAAPASGAGRPPLPGASAAALNGCAPPLGAAAPGDARGGAAGAAEPSTSSFVHELFQVRGG